MKEIEDPKELARLLEGAVWTGPEEGLGVLRWRCTTEALGNVEVAIGIYRDDCLDVVRAEKMDTYGIRPSELLDLLPEIDAFWEEAKA